MKTFFVLFLFLSALSASGGPSTRPVDPLTEGDASESKLIDPNGVVGMRMKDAATAHPKDFDGFASLSQKDFDLLIVCGKMVMVPREIDGPMPVNLRHVCADDDGPWYDETEDNSTYSPSTVMLQTPQEFFMELKVDWRKEPWTEFFRVYQSEKGLRVVSFISSGGRPQPGSFDHFAKDWDEMLSKFGHDFEPRFFRINLKLDQPYLTVKTTYLKLSLGEPAGERPKGLAPEVTDAVRGLDANEWRERTAAQSKLAQIGPWAAYYLRQHKGGMELSPEQGSRIELFLADYPPVDDRLREAAYFWSGKQNLTKK